MTGWRGNARWGGLGAVLLMMALSAPAQAGEPHDSLQRIETQWAAIHYGLPGDQQTDAYQPLLAKTDELARRYPNNAEAVFWQAVVKASHAKFVGGVQALTAVHEVRDLLNRVIALDPSALGGSAYVVLGSLYHQAPPWPLAYGDEAKAEQLFKKALAINPDGMESNYFYGDFLLANDRFEEAVRHFAKALAARARPGQSYADNQLKIRARIGLEKARARQGG